MLRVVYILVSGEKDYYYEQFLISATSLKYRMYNVEIVLLTEQYTNKYIQKNHKEVNAIADRIIVYEMAKDYNIVARSRVLKTKMRELIEGDFLYIDCDTVICDNLEDIGGIEHSSAVLDCHSLLSEKLYEFGPVKERAENFQFSPGYKNQHFNSGVIWCKDDERTRDFFSHWHDTWFETYKQGIISDQLSFNEVNHEMRGAIVAMEGIWNCQIKYGVQYLAKAKIIHYFATNINCGIQEKKFAYKLADVKAWKQVKERNGIPNEIMKLLYNPKDAFEKALLIEVDTANYHILNSNIGGLIRWLYRKHSNLYRMIDAFGSKLKKVMRIG